MINEISKIDTYFFLTIVQITKDKLLERREGLKDLQIEILDKFYTALELIPLPILEQFPKFNRDSFKKLQGLHRHVKAKLRLMQTKLSKLQKEDEKDISVSSGTPESVLNSNERPYISENCQINNDFDTSSSSISKAIDFHENLTNVTESRTKEHDNNIEPIMKSPETTIPSKKSTFQLKRPIKTVLDTQISKTIAKMWEKDQQISKTMNCSIDSEHDPISIKDTFNDSIKTPTKTETNMSIQQNTIRNSPNNWINTTNNKSQSKADNK